MEGAAFRRGFPPGMLLLRPAGHDAPQAGGEEHQDGHQEWHADFSSVGECARRPGEMNEENACITQIFRLK